jgi:hypothetical protein
MCCLQGQKNGIQWLSYSNGQFGAGSYGSDKEKRPKIALEQIKFDFTKRTWKRIGFWW